MVENTVMSTNNGGTTSKSIAIIESNSTVSNSSTSPKGLGATSIQPGAPQDLDLLSWPPDKYLPWNGKMKGYAYDMWGGRNTFIYVIDNGINMNNDVGDQS